ncbi:hypothetical protein Clacol_006190 [Clathrus columnatus]|uniref:RING-type domain-containing protein n=1 Tax=Clathrus columnatus TaxID=1419009 RepID=A0AAV5AE84_9AGAM|nr:hypothetical protein Clacol_006190 [Clathrus columnatus]
MGNTVSGSKDRTYEETVDFGALTPQGIYTGPQDWNQQIVGNLIVDRKLAPFYRPLEDYDESWDDEQILAARKELPNSPQSSHPESPQSTGQHSSKSHHSKNSNKNGKEPFRPSEASVYKGAVECPICFLYYPSNINRSRCCDQAICTECFVQIKRAEPTATHLVSEPAACPYCVQENFGVTYQPPEWRAGIDYQPSPGRRSETKVNPPEGEQPKRRKSFGADSPDVVTIDQIRPDWESKLAAVRAAVQRRANRRIIMRQVGDRLIPVGITSGRIVNMEHGEGPPVDTEGGSGRRRRRHHPNSGEFNQLIGQDLEELMIMEAMRLSLLEHEEQQRRQNANANANVNVNENTSNNRTEASAQNSTVSSSVPSNTTTGNTAITPSSSPGASPRTSLSPPNESGRSSSPSSSPRQNFNRISSPLVGSSETGLRRSSSSSRSGIIAALAAHTATAILSNETPETHPTENSTTIESTTLNGNGGTVETVPSPAEVGTDANSIGIQLSPEVRIDPPPMSPVENEQAPHSPPETSTNPDMDDLPQVLPAPPLTERTLSADDAAGERMPEGYVPLPSTTDLSDSLLGH